MFIDYIHELEPLFGFVGIAILMVSFAISVRIITGGKQKQQPPVVVTKGKSK